MVGLLFLQYYSLCILVIGVLVQMSHRLQLLLDTLFVFRVSRMLIYKTFAVFALDCLKTQKYLQKHVLCFRIWCCSFSVCKAKLTL